jgi:hypothetical protein
MQRTSFFEELCQSYSRRRGLSSALLFPDGKTYCFGSEAAKTEFMKDPKSNMAKAQEYYSSTHKKM